MKRTRVCVVGFPQLGPRVHSVRNGRGPSAAAEEGRESRVLDRVYR